MTIRVKLALSLFAVTSTLISIFSYVIFNAVSHRALAHSKADLTEYVDHEWAHLLSVNLQSNASITHSGMYLRILSNQHVVADTIPSDLTRANEIGIHDDYILIESTKDYQGERYRIIGLADLRQTRQYLRMLGGLLALGCLIFTGLLVPLSWGLSGVYLSPFRKLAQQTALLDASELAFRFPHLGPNDEFGKLVTAFNSLLEKMERSFRETNLFAAKASHELKTPLASIISQSEKMLRREDLPTAARQSSEKILNQSLRLSRITSQLLLLADVSGKQNHRLNRRLLLPYVMLNELVDVFSANANAKSKLISTEVQSDTPIWIDADLLSTSLSNLVENALKFGKKTVRLGYSQQKDEIIFSVEDDGPGIPQNERVRVTGVFEKNLTLPDGSDNPGSGLGFAITRAAVDVLEGKLSLSHSDLGGLKANLSFRADTLQHQS